MRVNRFLMPIVVVVALLGTALAAQAAGLWSTSGRELVETGSLAPADIKGWMTLQQVSDGIGISIPELYSLAGIPADLPPSTALKDMEGIVDGFEITVMREKLEAWQSSAPATAPAQEPAAPTAAQSALESAVRATATALAESGLAPATATALPETTLTLAVDATPEATHAPGSGDGSGVGPTPLPAGQVLPADQIRGRMTLGEISGQCAVPLEALLAELGLPADTSPGTTVKDLISQGVLTEVTQVQSAVAKLQSP